MNPVASASRSVKMGEFQLDLASGELVRNGSRVRLQVQSLELLKALLERPGAMVAREDLRRRLWPDDTFVDFDHGLNAAVRRLREALGDSADTPRFVETIPRKGYRLIAPIDDRPAASPSTDGVSVTGASEPGSCSQPAVGSTVSQRSPGIRWVLAAGLAAAGVLAAWAWTGRPLPASRSPVALLTIDVPDGWFMRYWDLPAVSPDGRFVAFTATGPQRDVWLWLHPLGGDAPRRIAKGHRPFWSADSRTIGFFDFGGLVSVPVAGGNVQTLASAPLNGGGTWLSNGDILFTPIQGRAIYRLAGGAGTPQPATDIDAKAGELGLEWPYAVPGTDRFTFVSRRSGTVEVVGRLAGIGARRSTDLGPTDSRMIPTASGHLLWVRDGTLLAQRLDDTRSTLVGGPTAIARDVAVRPATRGHFSAATTSWSSSRARRLPPPSG